MYSVRLRIGMYFLALDYWPLTKQKVIGRVSRSWSVRIRHVPRKGTYP